MGGRLLTLTIHKKKRLVKKLYSFFFSTKKSRYHKLSASSLLTCSIIIRGPETFFIKTDEGMEFFLTVPPQSCTNIRKKILIVPCGQRKKKITSTMLSLFHNLKIVSKIDLSLIDSLLLTRSWRALKAKLDFNYTWIKSKSTAQSQIYMRQSISRFTP